MSFYGSFNGENSLYFGLGSALLFVVLGYTGMPFIIWTAFLAVAFVGFGAPLWLMIVLAIVAVIGNVPPLRQMLVSTFVMKILKGVMPAISETERTALEAGVVWAEGDLFSGKPDFAKLMSEPYPQLTAEEQAFVDGPTEELCAALDEWKIWKKKELPQEYWDLIKKHRFLGMIIPKEYGGLGFTALAHSAVIKKLASRSVPATVTTMVPNSLGPAELLIHYGTDAQKNKWLERLAKGEEIPCFGLTEPNAGSDAGSITSHGELFKGDDGKIYIKLNWNKRWITLAAISTVIGLAFRLRDPKNLLGKGEDVGITCALIPAKTPGVILGQRHDPLGIPFYNCPTQGKDVIVDAEDAIIGGLKGAGHGWSMLMDCLAAGRGISLPAQSVGGAALASRVTSAHSTIRKQFGISISKFEGVEEPLARIAGYTYLLEAMRVYVQGALDKGIKPPVITAIAKHYSTEIGRKVINDAMDIMGGAGISLGPRNLIANAYITTPIGITVEGANIMTRTLIVFGQGALRAHPYAFKEVDAIGNGDLKAFDRAFWSHIGHIVRNLFRAVVLSITRGSIASSPVGGPTRKYYKKLAWASATFATMADIAMGVLGGSLKMREKLTGRFADILAWMFMATAVLRRWEAEGRRQEDLPFVRFAMAQAFTEMDKAFDGIFTNFKGPGITWFFHYIVRSWSAANTFMTGGVSDAQSSAIAHLISQDSEQRERVCAGIYVPRDPNQQMGRLERAFKIVKASEAIEAKLRKAIRAKQLPKVKKLVDVAQEAISKNIISATEADTLRAADEVREDAIQVDSFTQEEYMGLKEYTTPAAPTLKRIV